MFKNSRRYNFDCKVNIEDYAIFIHHYGQDPGLSSFLPDADINHDNYIDIKDFYLLITQWDKTIPPAPPASPTRTPTSIPTTAPSSTPIPTRASTPSPSPTNSANAQFPSDLSYINWNQWKITFPTKVNGSLELKNLINYKHDEFFHLNAEKNGVVFRTPIRSTNETTANSSNIRSELRERTSDGKSDIYWTTSGKHVLYVKQKITHLPMTVPIMVASQVHGCKACGGSVGKVDDAAVLRLERDQLYISFNGGSEMIGSDGTKVSQPAHKIGTYILGTMHEFIIEITNGEHRFYYSEDGNLEAAYNNGTASQYLVRKGSDDVLLRLKYGEAYFKAGNYTQSNSNKEGSNTNKPENYGEVILYNVWVRHQ